MEDSKVIQFPTNPIKDMEYFNIDNEKLYKWTGEKWVEEEVKVVNKVQTELGTLIDAKAEKFREFCSDKDMGYLSSFHNLLVQTYNQVKEIKNLLIARIKVRNLVDDKIELEKSLNGVYAKLLATEEKVFIVREIIESRKLEQ